MNQNKLSTILAFVLLLLGAFAGIYLVRRDVGFLPRATPETTPKQVKITNLNHDSFVVSWVTENPATGFVRYGTTANDLGTSASDDRDKLTGEVGSYRTHYVTLQNLNPETKHYFKIGSENLLYDRNGQPFSIDTPSILGTPQEDTAFGTIMTAAQTPADGAIVYLTLAGATPLSGLVNSTGNYRIPLSMARTLNLRNYAVYDPTNTVMSIEVDSGRNERTTVASTTGNSKPIPPITMGQSSNQATNQQAAAIPTQTPFPTLTPLPTPVPTIASAAADQITIDELPAENTILNEAQPEFNGVAPSNTTLHITVNSSTTYTQTVITDPNGNWSYQIPGDLEPGPHTITISYTDGNGILQQFIRSFVVQAAEGTGGSYGAGSTVPPSPTPTPYPTLAPRSAYPSTSSGVPISGSASQTWVMVFGGLMLLVAGTLIVKKISV